jgi:hypothetical protein
MGSPIWNNFHDGMGSGADCADAPERLDLAAYLQFLKEHGHNFIRLWRWEQFKSQAAGGAFHRCMTPQPGPRVAARRAASAGPIRPPAAGASRGAAARVARSAGTRHPSRRPRVARTSSGPPTRPPPGGPR